MNVLIKKFEKAQNCEKKMENKKMIQEKKLINSTNLFFAGFFLGIELHTFFAAHLFIF